MGRIVVEVMPKPEILDPQGKAVVGSLPRLGFDQFTGVRQGRRFELTVDGPVTDAHLAAAAEAASTTAVGSVGASAKDRSETTDMPATRTPRACRVMASMTVDMPTQSTPRPERMRVSAIVWYSGPRRIA